MHPESPRTMLWLAAAVAAVLLTQVLFYTTPLYNSAPDAERRLVRWQLVDAQVMWDVFEPRTEEFAVERLAQRIPPVLTGCWLVGVALLLGVAATAGVPLRGAAETWTMRAAIGFGWLALAVQALGWCGLLQRWALVVLTILAAVLAYGSRRCRVPPTLVTAGEDDGGPRLWGIPVWSLTLLPAVPFVLAAWLGALLPTTDYDALNYHLLGPKEHFLAGRVSFLPHNVYTTFPALTEMVHLGGMVAAGDWFIGALAGQWTLSLFGLLAAAGVGLLAGRLFGPRAAWLAAALYLCTPWIYRISVIPYVEGPLLAYTVLALYAALRASDGGDHADRFAGLSGALAGCAVGCKYTGVVMTAVPVFAVLMLTADRRRLRRAGWFVLGAAVLAGPWLVRNWVWTGNPVYPLLYGVFGGIDWDDQLADKFARAHSATDFSWASLRRYLWEIPIASDWQTGLVVAFAPLALLWRRWRTLGLLAGLVAYWLLAFWGLTHRLDRFWLPMLPVLVVLAAAGLTWTRRRLWWLVLVPVLTMTWAYQFVYVASPLCGLNAWFADLDERHWANFGYAQSMADRVLLDRQREGYLRRHRADGIYQVAGNPPAEPRRLPPLVPPAADGSRPESVLFVGDSAVFAMSRPTYSNTVFDRNVWLQTAREREGLPADAMPSAGALDAVLRQWDVDLVVVDWGWIGRYRQPGNYGYDERITPALFAELVAAGVLNPPAVFDGPHWQGVDSTGRPYVSAYDPADPAASGFDVYEARWPTRPTRPTRPPGTPPVPLAEGPEAGQNRE